MNNSPFKILLEEKGFEVIGQSLIKFKRIPFKTIPKSDWIFFYSRNGVRYFFQTINKDLQNSLVKHTTCKFGCIGPATARALQKAGYPPEFTGSGDPESTAQKFLDIARDKNVLFVRARNSQNSVARILGKKLKSAEIIAYDNYPISKPQIPRVDALVFTSPMNADCYFQHYPKQKGQKIIAMGKTTASLLKQLKVGPFSISAAPNEAALAKKVLERLRP